MGRPLDDKKSGQQAEQENLTFAYHCHSPIVSNSTKDRVQVYDASVLCVLETSSKTRSGYGVLSKMQRKHANKKPSKWQKSRREKKKQGKTLDVKRE